MPTLNVAEVALPAGYRYHWMFCLLPTLHRGRTIWLKSIPVLQRAEKNISMGMNWGDNWITVAVLDEIPTGKPAFVGDL